MVSIGRYLRSQGAPPPPPADDPSGAFTLQLAAGLVDSVSRHVFVGEKHTRARSLMADWKAQLQPDLTSQQAGAIAAGMDRILLDYHSSAQQSDTGVSVEIQHIVGLLNEALQAVANGSDRSTSRLNKIVDNLRQTAAIHDIGALRSALSTTVRLVEEESAQEKAAAAGVLASIGDEAGRAQEFLRVNKAPLAGRPEGVRVISEHLSAGAPNLPLYSVALQLNRLDGIVKRYGPAIADELILRLIRERLQPLTPSRQVFQWNSSSLVGVFSGQGSLAQLRNQLNELNRTPVVYRVMQAGRIAVLKVTPSHLVSQGTRGGADALISELDQFTGNSPIPSAARTNGPAPA